MKSLPGVSLSQSPLPVLGCSRHSSSAKQTYRQALVMSALLLKADIRRYRWNFRFVPANTRHHAGGLSCNVQPRRLRRPNAPRYLDNFLRLAALSNSRFLVVSSRGIAVFDRDRTAGYVTSADRSSPWPCRDRCGKLRQASSCGVAQGPNQGGRPW